ncbi:Clavaminate synthase-like protein [Acephala macrosclerotiorum]|nr:Clavaminate synthase-like protein [Acephala macrosclerotiorum]
MPSQQLFSEENDGFSAKFPNIEMREDANPAQHTPLYPSLARIGYVPDLELHQARLQSSRKRLQASGGVGNLPKEWPQVLQGPLVWSGSDLQTSNEWVYNFSEMDIKEIRSGLEHCKGLKLELSQVKKTSFPLPRFGKILEDLSSKLHNGRGFFILKGLDPKEFTREDNVILYLGISSYIAEQRGRQSHDGSLITHITDAVLSNIPRPERPSLYSNVAQPYHNDITPDILALYCLNSAISGGKSCIASSWTVYNELAETRPDIIRTLAEDSWNTAGGFRLLKSHALLYNNSKGRPILNFSRRILTSNDNFPRTRDFSLFEPLTEAQAEALDAVNFTAVKHGLEINLLPGDMCFVNNLALLHGRNAFEDSDESKRYFLRLWLRDPERAWDIPEGLRKVHDLVFQPQPDIEDHWDIDPYSAKGHELKSSTNCG